VIKGYDISAYQGNIAPAADFVIVKATEGKSYTNSRFSAQWASAKTRAKHRGAYHFARPEQSTAAAQAARFLAVVKPVPGESVWLDLEASDLSQAQTNAWAKAWGDYIREHAPGVTSGVYMGSGYASNGTGKDLAQHFSLWWYAQYPTAAKTSTWRSTFSPWLPSGLTCGWSKPHIWQWTSNFNGMDANISTLTLNELAGTGEQPTPLEDDMAAAVSLGTGAATVPANGSASIGWKTESSDKHKWAGPGDDGKTYSIYPDGPYWANVVAWLRVTGLKQGDALDLAWSTMKKDAKGNWTVANDPWRVTVRGDGSTSQEFSLPAQFPVTKDTPIRVRVYSKLDYPVSVTTAVCRAMFLKY
jgi:hypothetical protein